MAFVARCRGRRGWQQPAVQVNGSPHYYVPSGIGPLSLLGQAGKPWFETLL
jgi:hypothetical protein